MYLRPLRFAFGALALCVVAVGAVDHRAPTTATATVTVVAAPSRPVDLASFKASDEKVVDDLIRWEATAVQAVPQPETAAAPSAPPRTIVKKRPAVTTEAPPAPSGGSAEAAVGQYFGDLFDKAWRVAGCESGHNPAAVSPGGGNWGLFQINSVHKAGFEAVTGQPWSAVLNPFANAQYARYLYDQSGWGPWTCGGA